MSGDAKAASLGIGGYLWALLNDDYLFAVLLDSALLFAGWGIWHDARGPVCGCVHLASGAGLLAALLYRCCRRAAAADRGAELARELQARRGQNSAALRGLARRMGSLQLATSSSTTAGPPVAKPKRVLRAPRRVGVVKEAPEETSSGEGSTNNEFHGHKETKPDVAAGGGAKEDTRSGKQSPVTPEGSGPGVCTGTGRHASAGEAVPTRPAAARPQVPASSSDHRASLVEKRISLSSELAQKNCRSKTRPSKREGLLVLSELLDGRESVRELFARSDLGPVVTTSPKRLEAGLAKNKTEPSVKPRGRVPGTAARCSSEAAGPRRSKDEARPAITSSAQDEKERRHGRRDLNSELRATMDQRRKEKQILADMKITK